MECPTCDCDKMRVVGKYIAATVGNVPIHWCPRCGTLLEPSVRRVPSLVDRATDFEATAELSDVAKMLWHKIGIHDAISRDKP